MASRPLVDDPHARKTCSIVSIPARVVAMAIIRAAPVVTKYQKRISGPLLDRINIHSKVPRVDYEKLNSHRTGEMRELICARVQAARNIQFKRFSNTGLPHTWQGAMTKGAAHALRNLLDNCST